jgi:hypothetical protein
VTRHAYSPELGNLRRSTSLTKLCSAVGPRTPMQSEPIELLLLTSPMVANTLSYFIVLIQNKFSQRLDYIPRRAFLTYRTFIFSIGDLARRSHCIFSSMNRLVGIFVQATAVRISEMQRTWSKSNRSNHCVSRLSD